MFNPISRVLKTRFVVIVSADGEWQAIPKIYPDAEYLVTPYGQYIIREINDEPVILMHGGWGKIPSAASVQYAIDRWNPELVINMGTCGGFHGEIERDTIIMATRTIVYDIINQIGDTDSTIKTFTTEIDTSWIKEPYPFPVYKGTIVSGDRDLRPEDIPMLKEKYDAKVGDWESGGIAYVCNKNGKRLLILRGVSDLVGSSGGEAYNGTRVVWVEAAEGIMKKLINSLPIWLKKYNE
jgi:adenosylhomocysteine nucleosidase